MNDSPLLGTSLRLPPSNLLAEQALLGALLSNNKARERCLNLRAEQFSDLEHGRLYARITERIDSGRNVTAVSLGSEFEHALLTNLIASNLGIINVSEYSVAISDCAARRQMIEIGEILVTQAFADHGSIDWATEIVARLDAVVSGGTAGRRPVVTFDQAMDAAIAAMDRAKDGPAGMPTGFRSIDNRLGGLEGGLVYVIGGRPGMGKSALGHKIAMNMARDGTPVLELSLEMSAVQLGRRALAAAANVSLGTLKRGDPSIDQGARIVMARKEIAGLPLWIDDAGGQTPRQISARVREWKRKHGVKVVMLDHLNLTQPDSENARENATATTGIAADAMLRIAKDNDVAVIELVQLNRALEAREDRRPTLADLRQSGNIEQNAYAVGFVYRPEYYLGSEPEIKEGDTRSKFDERRQQWNDRKTEVAGAAELIWAKVRDGEPGKDDLVFHGSTTTFSEPSNA
jgi:replicative DNA helicase